MARNKKSTANPNPASEPAPATEPKKAPASGLGTVMLKLSDIVVNNDTNQRHVGDPDAEEAFQTLCASIREEGLLQPPGVQVRRGKHHLVFGFRRYAALLAIYGANHEQSFALVKGGEREARMINYVENLARLDLAPYEHCITLSDMKRDGYTTAEIAEKTGKSVSHTENMIRIKAKLCSALWDEFVKRGRSANIMKFLKVAGKSTEAEQIALFNGPDKPEPATPAPVPSTDPASVPSTDPAPADASEASDEVSDEVPLDAAPAEPIRVPLDLRVLDLMNAASDLIGIGDATAQLRFANVSIETESYLAGMIDACRYLLGQSDDPILPDDILPDDDE